MPNISDLNNPHSKHQHLWVIVRYDLPGDPDRPWSLSTVKSVFLSLEAAEAEVDRLNTVNADKHCVYRMQIGRFVDGIATAK